MAHATLRGGNCDRRMSWAIRNDADHIQPFVAEQSLPIVISARSGKLRHRRSNVFRSHITNSYDLDVFESLIRLKMAHAVPTQPNHRRPHRYQAVPPEIASINCIVLTASAKSAPGYAI